VSRLPADPPGSGEHYAGAWAAAAVLLVSVALASGAVG
jgi:hypothetical protein